MCFVFVQTHLQRGLVFVLNHKDHRVVLSNVDVLRNCFCSTEEPQA